MAASSTANLVATFSKSGATAVPRPCHVFRDINKGYMKECDPVAVNAVAAWRSSCANILI